MNLPRGGAQVIPRPRGAAAGPPSPWHDRAHLDALPDLTTIRRRLEAAGPGVPHPIEHTGVPASAVVAPLYEHNGEVEVMFTRRAWHMRSHRGEVSFPGGRHDPGDEDLVATALREAHEETSLSPSGLHIIGELDHLTTVTAKGFIVPYVAALPGRPSDLVPEPDEVDEILYIPVRELLHPEAFRSEQWRIGNLDRPLYFFEVPGDTIWGATAAMLVNLLRIALDVPPVR